jgi:hypothetical protein
MALSNHDGGSRPQGNGQQQQQQQQGFSNPASDMAGAVIWGTTVNVEESMQTFRQFIRNYRSNRYVQRAASPTSQRQKQTNKHT